MDGLAFMFNREESEGGKWLSLQAIFSLAAITH